MSVVLGAVRKVVQHSGADKLRIVEVDVGAKELLRIVCGAPNVVDAKYVAVAKIGTVLEVPRFADVETGPLECSNFKIKKSKIRGEQSSGMICSLGELGFVSIKENDYHVDDGIWSISADLVESLSNTVQLGDTIPLDEWVDKNLIQHWKEYRGPLTELVENHWKVQQALGEIGNLLHWDQQVMMPPAGHQARGVHEGVVAKLSHEKSTSDEYGQLLKQATARSDMVHTTFEKRSLELAELTFKKATAVTPQEVEKLALLRTECSQRWAKARELGKYAIVQPLFEELLQRTVEVSSKIADATKAPSVMSSMLSDYSLDMDEARLGKIFGTIQAELDASKLAPKSDEPSMLFDDKHKFELEKQEQLGRFLIKQVYGESDVKNKIRLDKSTHPFCVGIAANDLRITTRYSPNNLVDGMMGTLHEAGHGLYELYMVKNREYPAAQALDIATHESQSLFWERMVGQSVPFSKFLAPKILNDFGFGRFDGTKTKDEVASGIYDSVNRISKTPIRVEADEFHYPLHVLVRFEIERSLIYGTLTTKQVPEKWNELYEQHLGIKVENDQTGCLQDPHWFFGHFGYFPSYTLGAVAAQQLYKQAEQDLGSDKLEESIEKGDFKSIREWLQGRVHQYGRMDKNLDKLCERITGKPMDVSNYCTYLQDKYLH